MVCEKTPKIILIRHNPSNPDAVNFPSVFNIFWPKCPSPFFFFPSTHSLFLKNPNNPLFNPSHSHIPDHHQNRVSNFAAGPATLPENVLKKAEYKLYTTATSSLPLPFVTDLALALRPNRHRWRLKNRVEEKKQIQTRQLPGLQTGQSPENRRKKPWKRWEFAVEIEAWRAEFQPPFASMAKG